jgi:3-phosphoshikimate 1-carboxyvinyltransferase
LAEDTEATSRGLQALGVEVASGEAVWEVEGLGGTFEGGATIDAGASGTTLRLLTAMAAMGKRPSRLGGVPRLAERPIEPLLEALRRLGAHASRLSRNERGAFLEAGGRPLRGGAVAVDGSGSSQFASALLTIGAVLPEGLHLSLHGSVVSLPYIGLTVEMLTRFGAEIREAGPRYTVAPTGLHAAEVEIEGDWSSASYLLAAAAILGGTVAVEGLRADSRQADAASVPLLRLAGALVDVSSGCVATRGTGKLVAFEVDLRQAPDLAPTAAVLALFCEGRSILTGIGHLRGKESDRLEAIAESLMALGRTVRPSRDALVVEAADRPLRAATIATRGDHRIAMAFALAALRLEGIELDDPGCVAKSYPAFWEDLQALRTGSRDRPTIRRDPRPWS